MKRTCKLWLLDTTARKEWRGWKRAAFWLWNLTLVTGFALAAGLVGLRLAYGRYDEAFFHSYFAIPGLVWRNLAPPVLLILMLWPLLRRAWLAFLLGGAVAMGFPAADYYVLRFRDEPLTPSLLKYLREAVSISSTSGYDLTPDAPLWMAIGLLLGGTALLALLARGRPRRVLLWVPVIGALLLEPIYRDTQYYKTAYDSALVDRFSATENFIARGFWYPFLHSALGVDGQLSAEDSLSAREVLDSYPHSHIPAESKLDVLIFQREAYVDFSVYGSEGMDWSCYDLYHALKEESYVGKLVTNTFSGGTIDTERCFLTGLWNVNDLPEEGDLNSYVWYFKDQGYTVEGCHPCYEWFYDRKTVNKRLGFDRYRFSEDTFSQLSGWQVAYDDILLPVVWDMYQEKTADGTPYFGFHVTYQGHGPYTATWVEWPGAHFSEGALEGEQCNIFNNYLGCIRDSDTHFTAFLDQLRESERPVAVLLYGDHKPWLGDNKEVYADLGISLDLSTEEGVLNYLTTEYVIWINPAAEKLLGRQIRGQGPTVSPCYLMNVLFEQLGWEGNGFLKLMEEYRQVMPVISTTGRYIIDGQFTADVPEERSLLVEEFRNVQQLWKTEYQK